VIAIWGFATMFRVPARRPQLGVGLGQIGEFSFVVLGLGTAAGVVSTGQFSAGSVRPRSRSRRQRSAPGSFRAALHRADQSARRSAS